MNEEEKNVAVSDTIIIENLKTCLKPTPSISKTQNTVDFLNKENVITNIKGRHDPCIVHRARVVIDSMVAIGLLDLYVQRYGYDWM